jgi:hypothetical protein
VARGASLSRLRDHIQDTPHSVGLLWTGDQPEAESSTWQHTTFTRDIHAPGEIRTHNPNKRSAENPSPRPHGHFDRLTKELRAAISVNIKPQNTRVHAILLITQHPPPPRHSKFSRSVASVREGCGQQIPDGQVVVIRAEVTSLDNRSNLKRPSERFYESEPYNVVWAVAVKLRCCSDRTNLRAETSSCSRCGNCSSVVRGCAGHICSC